jgi:Cu(I)/Ag(I) efflux system membrane protein CusA/SilA
MNQNNILSNEEREARIEKSSKLIGSAVVDSILITLISFSPILFLTGQEHKLFSPLVWTKTFAMIGSAFVVVFLVPVLMVMLLKGKVRAESKHPVSRFFNGCIHLLSCCVCGGKKQPLR